MASERGVDSSSPPSRAVRDYTPGSQILFSIPANPGGTRQVWGYVMQKPARTKDCVLTVIDEIVLVNAPPKYHCGALVEVPVENILAHMPADPHQPLLHVDIQSEALMRIKRVDGKTSPIVVEVDQDQYNSLYRVDHTGMQPIE